MTKALGIEPDISLEELLQVASSDNWSVQFNPMLAGPGGSIGGTFIRSAAPWKGLKKGDNESREEYLDRLSEVNEGVARGLETGIGMAMQTEGTSGVAVIEKGGTQYPVPEAAAQLAEQGSDTSVRRVYDQSFPSVNAALEQLTADTGRQVAFPTVY